MVAKEDPEPEGTQGVIRGIWRDFVNNTSLHGCKYVNRQNKHVLQRLLWAAFVLAAGVGLAAYMIKLYVEFKSYPFESQYRMERHTTMKLPAISVCNMNQFSKSKFNLNQSTVESMLAQSILSRQFPSLRNYTVSNEEYKKLNSYDMKEVSLKSEDFVIQAFISDKVINITAEFVAYQSSIFNRCFIFNGIKDDGSGGEITLTHGQYVWFLLNINQSDYFPMTQLAGAYLIFHDPNELPSPFGEQVYLSPGFMTLINLEPVHYHFLPKPFKSYGEEYCEHVHEELSDRKLQWHARYSWIACVEECGILRAVETCQCRPGQFVPESLSDRICSFEELYECFFTTAGKVRDSALVHNKSECGCNQPCDFIQYGVKSSVSAFPPRAVAEFLVAKGKAASYQQIRDNYIAVEVGYGSLVMQHVTHVPTFNLREVLGQLGGQMGFFLGASLLTLTEVLEAVTVSLAAFLYRRHTREKSDKVRDDKILIYDVMQERGGENK